MPTALPPTADDLLGYLGLTESNYSTAEAQEALDVATDMQSAQCDLTMFTDSLREARLRRAARNLASRGALLGYTDLGSFGGPVALQRWDSQVEALESDYRLGGFA